MAAFTEKFLLRSAGRAGIAKEKNNPQGRRNRYAQQGYVMCLAMERIVAKGIDVHVAYGASNQTNHEEVGYNKRDSYQDIQYFFFAERPIVGQQQHVGKP